MQYLIRTNGQKVSAHYWVGSDTACRMWSTGGIGRGRNKFALHDEPGNHPICSMCLTNWNRRSINTRAGSI
jgi:hypothetical protein